MKKRWLPILIVLLILVTLTGCQGSPYSFKEPIDEIKSIEIVSAETSLEYTVVKTLSKEEGEKFLEQLQKIKFYHYLGDPSSVSGDAIKITYQSGLYEMICSFSAEYVEDGVIQYRLQGCDEKEFNQLIYDFLNDRNDSTVETNTGFTTDDMALKEQQAFLSAIGLFLKKEEPNKEPIVCFDVNENGLIAIGTKDFEKEFISVYEPDGTFKYGYLFDCDGSFGIEWDHNNIVIYFVRSNVAGWFNEKGENVDLKIVQNTIDNSSYWNEVLHSTQRNVNGIQYTIQNNLGPFNIFAVSYSQLIKTDADGNTTILYDISNAYTIRFIIALLSAILFSGLAILIIVKQFIKLKNNGC